MTAPAPRTAFNGNDSVDMTSGVRRRLRCGSRKIGKARTAAIYVLLMHATV